MLCVHLTPLLCKRFVDSMLRRCSILIWLRWLSSLSFVCVEQEGKRGRNMDIELPVTLEDLYVGNEKSATIKRQACTPPHQHIHVVPLDVGVFVQADCLP